MTFAPLRLGLFSGGWDEDWVVRGGGSAAGACAGKKPGAGLDSTVLIDKFAWSADPASGATTTPVPTK